MTRYAEIVDGLVVGTKQMAGNFVAADVLHKTDWRIVNQLADPALGTNEKYGAWGYVVNANDVDAQRTVEVMSAAEIDAAVAKAAADTERDAVKLLYQALRDGDGTNGERLKRVERVAARLLRDQYSGAQP